jgi:hypothetical protein
MSDDEIIDITPIAGANYQNPSAIKLRKACGLHDERHLGEMPDGEVENEWDQDKIEDFMKRYLSMDRYNKRPQNNKRWNYAVWRFIVELYSESLTYKQIAERVCQNFEAYNLPDQKCNDRAVKSIIHHKGWRVADRMKQILVMERANSIVGSRKSACSKAQRIELDQLEDLQAEVRGCFHTLKGLDPAEKEYKAVVGSIKILNAEIERISGTGSVRKLEEFQAKEEIKAEKREVEVPKDPKTMIPNIHRE